MNSSLSFAKAWFAVSLLVLAFGYGFASHAWGLFPKSVVEQAWRQARAVMGTTSKPPGVSKVYDRSGARVVDPKRMKPGGAVLVTSSWRWGESDSLKPGAKLISRSGETLHSWHPDRNELFQGPGFKGKDPQKANYHGSHLFPNGDLLLNLSRIGLVRLNSCGQVLWRLKEGNHHSIARAEDGSFWTPGTGSEKRRGTSQYPDGFPGIDRETWIEQIVHVSERGKVLKKINVLDILYNNDLQRYLSKADQPQAGTGGPLWNDISHINDVEPLSSSISGEYPLFDAGDLLISLRNLHLVFVLDPDSGEVKWHASDPFITQHDPDFIGGGWVGVFDNNEDFTKRGRMNGGSRIIALQPHTDSLRVLFPTQRSEHFYTDIRGKWQKLENGNMLLTEANAGRVVEVAPDGETVWEWIHSPISKSRTAPVTEGTYYDLTRDEIASWSCSSVDSVSASAQKPSPQNQQAAP